MTESYQALPSWYGRNILAAQEKGVFDGTIATASKLGKQNVANHQKCNRSQKG